MKKKNLLINVIENSEILSSVYGLVFWFLLAIVTFLPDEYSEIDFNYRIIILSIFGLMYLILFSLIHYPKIYGKIIAFRIYKKIKSNNNLLEEFNLQVPNETSAIHDFLNREFPTWECEFIANEIKKLREADK